MARLPDPLPGGDDRSDAAAVAGDVVSRRAGAGRQLAAGVAYGHSAVGCPQCITMKPLSTWRYVRRRPVGSQVIVL
jgi:hypothetical protein